MKKRLYIAATLLVLSVGGVVTYLNQPITEIPAPPVLGIVVTKETTVSALQKTVKAAVAQNKIVYIGAYKDVGPAMQVELKKQRLAEQFRFSTVLVNNPTQHLQELIEQVSGRTDYAIIKI